jgi:hypothetical protein
MNPYTPPSSPAIPADDQRPALREIVLAWEKLRLLYNGLLVVPGLLVLNAMISQLGMALIEAVLSAVFVAVCANLCYLLGPVTELYLRGLFRQGQPLGRGRWLIFGSGTLLSFFLFILTYLQMKIGWP